MEGSATADIRTACAGWKVSFSLPAITPGAKISDMIIRWLREYAKEAHRWFDIRLRVRVGLFEVYCELSERRASLFHKNLLIILLR